MCLKEEHYGYEFESLTNLKVLRILAQDGPSKVAFQMLQSGDVRSAYKSFVLSIFLIFAGDHEIGMANIMQMWELVDNWEDAIGLGEMVVRQITIMGTRRSGMYLRTHYYLVHDLPHCIYVGCAGGDVCVGCYAYRFSHVIVSIC